jgi:hypothetical protein
VLQELLADASGRKPKNGVHDFADQERVSVLLSTDGAHFAIDEVGRIEVKDGYVVVSAARDAVYLLTLDRIIGVKLLRARREGPGFRS